MNSVTTQPEVKARTAERYSIQQEAELKAIAKKKRETWKPRLDEFVARNPGREYGSVYAKVHTIAKRLGNMPSLTRGNQYTSPKSRKVKKSATKRSSTRHPMKKNPLLAVNQKELRFPFKEIRLVNGEVVITI